MKQKKCTASINVPQIILGLLSLEYLPLPVSPQRFATVLARFSILLCAGRADTWSSAEGWSQCGARDSWIGMHFELFPEPPQKLIWEIIFTLELANFRFHVRVRGTWYVKNWDMTTLENEELANK